MRVSPENRRCRTLVGKPTASGASIISRFCISPRSKRSRSASGRRTGGHQKAAKAR
jgi:hypothetical protein